MTYRISFPVSTNSPDTKPLLNFIGRSWRHQRSMLKDGKVFSAVLSQKQFINLLAWLKRHHQAQDALNIERVPD